MKRVGPQAIVPAGLTICGKIVGLWAAVQAPMALDRAPATSHTPPRPTPEGRGRRGAEDAPPWRCRRAASRVRAAASPRRRRGVMLDRVAEVARARRRARMRDESAARPARRPAGRPQEIR